MTSLMNLMKAHGEIPDEVLIEMGLLDGPMNEPQDAQEGLEEASDEDVDVLTELRSSQDRTRRAEPSSSRNVRARVETERNVRPRTGEPEAERGEPLPQSRRESASGQEQPRPWPSPNLDDLPQSLRAHFERQAERNNQEGAPGGYLGLKDPRKSFVAFMATRFEASNPKGEIPSRIRTR